MKKKGVESYLYLFACFIWCSIGLSQQQRSYKDYKLVKVWPQSSLHTDVLSSWEKTTRFDVWLKCRQPTQYSYILISPNDYQRYQIEFDRLQIPFEIIESDIERKIKDQMSSMALNENTTLGIAGKYASYEEIINYINQIERLNSDIASSYIAGYSYENREIRVLVLKTQYSVRSVFLECGITGREWLSPATCIWFIHRLIDDYRRKDTLALEVLKYYEFHILPLMNPDGYEYTFSADRFWRKNRRPNPGSTCVGTDLNRNFGFRWMEQDASSDPCSEVFAGPEADSEPETIAVQSAIKKKLGNWDAYITFHAYGLYWLFPWSYARLTTEEYLELNLVSTIGAIALKSVNGTMYQIGSGGILLGEISGVSDDWMRGVANISYSMTLILRPGDNDPDIGYGFTLPEPRVPIAGEETYVGLKYLFKAIKTQNRKNKC